MISAVEILWENHSFANWQAAQNQPENADPDSDLTDLIPALSRLLAWLSEGKECEQKGMRVVAMLSVVRPDFLHEKSLKYMSNTSKQNLSKLCVDFRQTFGWRASAQQVAAKRRKT